MQREFENVLVGLEYLACLREVEDLFLGVVVEGIEEGGRRLSEEDAFAPAGGHVESGKSGWRGRDGGTKAREVRWLFGIRRAMLSRPLAFLLLATQSNY